MRTTKPPPPCPGEIAVLIKWEKKGYCYNLRSIKGRCRTLHNGRNRLVHPRGERDSKLEAAYFVQSYQLERPGGDKLPY